MPQDRGIVETPGDNEEHHARGNAEAETGKEIPGPHALVLGPVGM